MKKRAIKTEGEALLIPRVKLPRGPLTGKGIEEGTIVAFYNRYRELAEGGDVLPESLKASYQRILQLLQQCRTWEIDASAYLEWAWRDVQERGEPHYLFGWMRSEKVMRRFWIASRRPAAAERPAASSRLIDARTGQPVRWAYDTSGRLLTSLPPSGPVYDRHGHPIPLQRG